MSVTHSVHIEHWRHPRLPATHHLHERWSIMFRGRARLTFSSAAEAIEAARTNGWVVERTVTDLRAEHEPASVSTAPAPPVTLPYQSFGKLFEKKALP